MQNGIKGRQHVAGKILAEGGTNKDQQEKVQDATSV